MNEIPFWVVLFGIVLVLLVIIPTFTGANK